MAELLDSGVLHSRDDIPRVICPSYCICEMIRIAVQGEGNRRRCGLAVRYCAWDIYSSTVKSLQDSAENGHWKQTMA